MAGIVSRETRADIAHAIHLTWAVGLGLIPLGLAFGLLMTQSGYAWWWTPIFSLVIYAGSVEFLAINLVATGIAPGAAALTGLLINFRHIFYGLTYPRHLISSRLGRAYSSYALTDESYAIVSAQPRSSLNGTQVLAVQIFCQALWVIPGILGALIGSTLPQGIKGMEFALIALFVVLAWETFAQNRDWSLPLTAAALAVVCAVLIPHQMLVVALLGYFFILIARYCSPRLNGWLTLRAAGAPDPMQATPPVRTVTDVPPQSGGDKDE